MPTHTSFRLLLITAALTTGGCLIGVSGPGGGAKPPIVAPSVAFVPPTKGTAPRLADRWHQSTTATRQDLAAVSAPSGLVAFAVGAKGTVVKTLDGGETWKLVTPTPAIDDDLVDVAFLEARTGWALGGKALYVTKDGGETWTTHDVFGKRQALGASTSERPQLALASYERGALLARGAVFATTDAGATWNVLAETESASSPSRGGLQAGRRLVAMGDGYGLLASGGFYRLGREQPEKVPGFEGYTALDVAFRDLDHGWMVGNGAGGAASQRTTDGGKTWTSSPIRMQPAGDPTAYLFPHQLATLAVVDDQRAWLVGKGNQGWLVAETVDGATWSAGRVMEGGASDLAAPDASHAYAPTLGGVMQVLTSK